jgi:hypothetical protein
VFFAEQSGDPLMEAILAFEAVESEFSPALIRAQVERFDVAHFKEQLGDLLQGKVHQFRDFAERRTNRTTPESARTASSSLK